MVHEQPSADSPKPRRWMTYSLRGMFALMVIASVGFAWFGAVWNAKQREREAVAAFEELGAAFIYDYQLNEDGEWINPPLDPPGPAWLRSLLGDDWSAAPQHLQLTANIHVTDADLVHLRELKQLKTLAIAFTQVTDEGVAELQKALPNCEISHCPR
ncbi:MAG: hypothetical protein N2C14_06820 [Planctomycetales bacterium]